MTDEYIYKITRWIATLIAIVLLGAIAFGAHSCDATDKKQTACIQAGRDPLACKELR